MEKILKIENVYTKFTKSYIIMLHFFIWSKNLNIALIYIFSRFYAGVKTGFIFDVRQKLWILLVKYATYLMPIPIFQYIEHILLQNPEFLSHNIKNKSCFDISVKFHFEQDYIKAIICFVTFSPEKSKVWKKGPKIE